MQSDLLQSLNEPQQRAVQTVDGRVLILAGAGSGKTRVLTARMAHLIKNHRVSPKSILGLTFTNKAASEMRRRIARFIPLALARQLTLCTFHSFCMQVLREEIATLGYTNQFTLYDEKDVHRLISMIARDILEVEGELPSLAETVAAVNMARNKGVQPDDLTGTGSDWHDDFTRNVYKRLQESMRAYNAVDFDNLLCLTVQLFEKHPTILLKYQEQYRYIMIDEYQDTNPIQSRLAELLASKYQNLCVVGDDDQSIYGWRGADIRNILDFHSTEKISLEQNYRSVNHILQTANSVICHNTQRHSKNLWSQKGEGDLVEIFYAPNEAAEAEAVVCRIAKIRENEGLRWSDIAILYRSSILSRQFEIALSKYTWYDRDAWIRGIPYEVFGGQEFFERREVRDLYAYLRVIINPLDQEALLRIINQPRRGIGEGALDALTTYNRKSEIPLWEVLRQAANQDELPVPIHAKALEGIRQFVSVIEEATQKFSQGSLYESMVWLIESTHYKKAIHEEVKSDQMREFKWSNVKEFASCLADYEEGCRNGLEKKPSLVGFLSDLPLDNEWDTQKKEKQRGRDAVKLMTLHSSKGLEFPVCFLTGVEDHILPHEKSVRESGVEEERRLLYVGITRAMRRLTISMAVKRKKMGQEHLSKPSRFLQEIPDSLLKKTRWDCF